ncbi:hypothetical protein CTAYLR_003706 [Chrysophaeum taylorii]|uniref:TauD/TfdA-like domain-containing protein n=1 Tax=Chrysophaeum taylorii TaxID=2483200 RepID=A0AAD7XPT4_9STRA|nr:hypothetical protein CTAYLR_003706 [Chrysophaeum taylorii]
MTWCVVVVVASVVASGFVVDLGGLDLDIEALASSLGSAAQVEELFLVNGEPRQFLRRQQFLDVLSAKSSDAAALELWLYFGGAPPRAGDLKRKKETKGFFGAFADTLKQNAMGTVDDRATQWRPLSRELGVVGDGQSLPQAEELRRALEASRGLLVLRNVGLTRLEFVELCAAFGQVEERPLDGPYEAFVEGDARVHEFSEAPSSRRERLQWHQDQTFREPRPRVSVMYCLETRADEGDTLFASTVAAREDLPPEVVAALEGVEPKHSRGAVIERLGIGSDATSDVVSRPLLHEDGLCLSPQATQDHHLPLVEALAEFTASSRYAHRWRAGDLVFWDNHRALHAATSLRHPADRRMWRATVVGDRAPEPLETLVVPAPEATTLVADAIRAAGAAGAATARALVRAELDGKPGHGARRAIEVCEALERGDVAARPTVTKTISGSVLRVDAGGGLAFDALEESLGDLVALADELGLAALHLTNSRSISGRLAPVVEDVASRGLVAVAFANTPAYLAAAGGSGKVSGTNPIAFAVPPIVVDMALAGVSRGDIELRRARGESLEFGLAVDASGRDTTDPADVLDRGGAQLPAGGIKGALLALLVEILAGALTGSDLAIDSNDYHTMNRGMLVLAFKPAAATTFARDIARLVEALPFVPGDRTRQHRAKNADDLIHVPPSLFYDLSRRSRRREDHPRESALRRVEVEVDKYRRHYVEGACCAVSDGGPRHQS